MTHDICLLGGTGFVGSHLAALLASGGHRVLIPSRRAERHRGLQVMPTVTVCDADVHDEAELKRLFQGRDAVINLIGVLNPSRADSFRRVHVELPRKVAQSARAAGVPRLLHMSALGADAGNAPSLFLRSKGEGEAALRVHAGDALDYTVFQPSVIFGPGDSFISRFAALMKFAPLVPLARAGARFQPVYVDDVATAFVRALDDRASHGKRYQLCGPRVYTLREIIEYTASAAGLRRRVLPLPLWLGKIQATLMGLLPGKPLTRDNLRSLKLDSVCGAANGLAAFGITPQPLELIVPRYLGSGGHRNRLSSLRGRSA